MRACSPSANASHTSTDPTHHDTNEKLGMGGVTAELLSDTVTLILPVNRAEIEDALHSLQLWPLLNGWRGREKPDTSAAVDAALVLQEMMRADPRLEELEINPLILRANGAVAVDAVLWEEN